MDTSMESTCVWNSCIGYFELVFCLEYFLWHGLQVWNPCLCKGLFMPWDYVPFKSHLWLCRSPRGCSVLPNTNDAFFLGSEMNKSTCRLTSRSSGWMQ